MEGRRASVRCAGAGSEIAPRARRRHRYASLLCGATVLVFEEVEGWAWVQAEQDGYVGYASADALAALTSQPTHVVVAQRTFVYPGPELKMPPVACHSMGALLNVVRLHRSSRHALREARLRRGGHRASPCSRPIGKASDFVAVCRDPVAHAVSVGRYVRFRHRLLGHRAAFHAPVGPLVLRDTDMQGDVSRRADRSPAATCPACNAAILVFWKGHVGIMRDADELLHANGHTMSVASEPLREAVERIAHLYGRPTGYRRP